MSSIDGDPFKALINGYVFDPASEWSEADEVALWTWLTVALHFEEGHDPVACQINNVRTTDPRGGHQERDEWRRLREDAGLTLRQLARQVGSTKENISRYESNRRKPEDEHEYFAFLRGQADELAALARMRVWMLARHRDGWWTIGDHWTQEARLEHWDVMFKEGGLFDKWRDTGTLPVWTPADAGFVGV